MKIILTKGNIQNGHFYLERSTSLFPKEAWGGKNGAAAGIPLQVSFLGTGEEVTTDIDGTKRIFRNARGEISRFFKANSLAEGDAVLISKLEENRFKVEPQKGNSLEQRSLLPSGSGDTRRAETRVNRIVRDSQVAESVKELYGYACQICQLQIRLPNRFYAEGAHIRPLGSPHNGPDSSDNLLCLCPNHHVMLDGKAFTINDDLTLNGISGRLHVISGHEISLDFRS